MPQKLPCCKGKEEEGQKALAMMWFSSKALKRPDEPSTVRQKHSPYFFSLPTMVIMNPTNKNPAPPKHSQRLDRPAGWTLQDTAHLWNTWFMIYKANTVQNTEQAGLLCLVQILRTQDLLHGPVQVSGLKSSSDQLIIHLFSPLFWGYHHNKHLQLPGTTPILFNQAFYEFIKLAFQ